MTSSSNSGPGHEPWLAKLNAVFDKMGWCAAPSDSSPYLQIDMGRVVTLTHIAVAGKSGAGMVSEFKFSSSVDGGFWRIYTTVSGEKVNNFVCYLLSLFRAKEIDCFSFSTFASRRLQQLPITHRH